MNMLKKYLTMMLLLGLACPATACNSSSSSEDEVPPHLKPETPEEPGRDYYPKADGATRLVTYNVGVFTKYISDGSYQMIADMMTEGKADLVGISELDSCTVRTGRVFQLKKFAELMGKEWSYEYSRAMAYQGGAYGDGIASREKPVRTFAAPLPKGDGAEPRVMVVMEFAKYVFATTHLDHVSTLAQAGQVDEINKVIEREFGSSKKPVFLGGDFNARPDSPTISKLKTGWTVLTPHGASDFTHSSQAPNKCIDYILLVERQRREVRRGRHQDHARLQQRRHQEGLGPHSRAGRCQILTQRRTLKRKRL